MNDSNSKFYWWVWAHNAEDALKDAGGTLTIKQACQLLQMPQEELRARFEERSILFFEVPEMYGEGEIIIPAFQFQGAFHIPCFHEIWDILINGCKTEWICQFFAQESLDDNGRCIRDVLCSSPTQSALQAIREKAQAFAQTCSTHRWWG